MEVQIEQARPQHAARIEALELEALAGDPCRLAEAAFRRKNEPVVALVALAQGEVQGYVTAATFWHGHSLNLVLMALVVAPERRRHGIGRRLLDALIDTGRALGATRVRLFVRPENEPALSLYNAAGFRPLARQEGGPELGEDVLVMARSTRRQRGSSERRL